MAASKPAVLKAARLAIRQKATNLLKDSLNYNNQPVGKNASSVRG
jgi:hypothetical protein